MANGRKHFPISQRFVNNCTGAMETPEEINEKNKIKIEMKAETLTQILINCMIPGKTPQVS